MKGEEKVIKKDERITAFVAKRLEAQDAKRRKTAEENPPEAMVESAARPRGVVRHRQAAVLIPNVVTVPLKMENPNMGGNQRGGRRTLARRTCRST